MTFGDKDLSELYDAVRATMSEKRFRHTESVEAEIARMGEIYLTDRVSELRAAALLHDIAKEYPIDEQIRICSEHGDPELETSVLTPAILHGHVAAYLIPDLYPKYALPEIISAIYKHTTGAEEMSVFDELLFLADFIEPLRPWDSCQMMRAEFWGGMPTDQDERVRHLDLTVLSVLDFTLAYLLERGIVPDPTTERAARSLHRKYPNFDNCN